MKNSLVLIPLIFDEKGHSTVEKNLGLQPCFSDHHRRKEVEKLEDETSANAELMEPAPEPVRVSARSVCWYVLNR